MAEKLGSSNSTNSVLKAGVNCVIKPFDDLALFSCDDLGDIACLLIVRKNHVYYPNPARIVEDPKEWSELNCSLYPIRIAISCTTFKASLQVFGQDIMSIPSVLKKVDKIEKPEALALSYWEVSSELLELIKRLTKYGNYRLCEGFAEKDLTMFGDSKARSLVKISLPFPRYESPKCMKLISPGHSKEKTFCQACNKWLIDQKCYSVKRAIQESSKDGYTPPTKVQKTDVRSKVPIAYLTPKSKKSRINSLCKSRRVLSNKVLVLQKKINKMTVTLSSEQNDEMVDIVNVISKSFPSELQSVINEGENFNVSRQLRETWKKDRLSHHHIQQKDFFKDQLKNRTGYKGNAWSSITYRLALAVYIRSPAAYIALKSFRILNLPSESSLKDFTTARLQDSGINHDYLLDQQKLYQKLKDEQKNRGVSEPLGEGIIIFDEVRVISKLQWNSSNNQLCGLALKKEEYSTLSDVYEQLKSENPEKPTDYILQFIWRDISFTHDVIGPYISSSGPVKKDILVGCLYDVIRVFESYGFHVRAVICDGASTNLSVIKGLMDVKGPFGYDKNETDLFKRHSILPCIKHPFRPFHKIFFMICPSHQLKSMIAALYSSRARVKGGTKQFEKKGIEFGWNPIVQVYDEDLKRSKQGEAKRVKKLLKSYVHRDNWTRLNVLPAKIMQQDDMLIALNEIAAPAPPHAKEILTTKDYLTNCHFLFESGILNREHKIMSVNDPLFEGMLKGYSFFTDWINELLANPDFTPTSKDQKLFLSWQTWDLLRIMVFGFISFCQDFLKQFPTRFILPLRINGSAIETLFGQMRFSAAGKLSGVNYAHHQRSLLVKYDIHGRKFNRDDYRKAPLAVAEMELKRKKPKRMTI